MTSLQRGLRAHREKQSQLSGCILQWLLCGFFNLRSSEGGFDLDWLFLSALEGAQRLEFIQGALYILWEGRTATVVLCRCTFRTAIFPSSRGNLFRHGSTVFEVVLQFFANGHYHSHDSVDEHTACHAQHAVTAEQGHFEALGASQYSTEDDART